MIAKPVLSSFRVRSPALLLAASAIAVAIPTAASAQVKFKMDVSPLVGGLEDRFTVTVEIELPGISGPDRYWHPTFRYFTVLESTEPQKSTYSVSDPSTGRRLTTSVVRTYVIQPQRVGTLAITPARMKVGKTDYTTDVVYVTVTTGPVNTPSPVPTPVPVPRAGQDPTAAGGVGAPGFTPPDPRHATSDIFLHAVVDKTKLFVGEQAIVTWLLYTRTDILRWEPKPPRLDGLWAETLYEPTARFNYAEDRVGSLPYQVVIVAKRALFPTKPGKLSVSPLIANVASLSTAIGRKKRVASNAIQLQVEPLPAGAPPGFDPTYVGVFQVDASADRTEIDAAESLTLTLRVRGQGAIRRTTPPRLQLEGFEFREPRDFDETTDVSSDVVSGERVYRYWTTPKKGGSQDIPPIEITYFDPNTRTYDVARTKPISIVVRGDPSKVAKPEGATSHENVIAKDIRLIADHPAVESRRSALLFQSVWFWLLAALPPLVFAAVVSIDRLRRSLKKETPRARLRRARGRARQRFRVAEIHMRGNRIAKFYGELSRVLTDHIEERVGKPVQSMTRDELVDFLKARGFSESTVRQIDHDLEAFDQARFAPSASGQEEMKEALRKTKQLLGQIERTQLTEEPEAEAAGQAGRRSA